MPRYTLESLAQVESTRVDGEAELRARAMTAPAAEERGPRLETPLRPPARTAMSELHGDALSGLGAAMLVRVRFVGAEVPLWSLIAPAVIVAALVAALAASAVSRARGAAALPRQAVAAAGSTPLEGAALPEVQKTASEAVPAPSAASAPAERVEPASAAASAALAALPAPAGVGPLTGIEPGRHPARDLLALAEKGANKEREAARKLERALDRDPGLIREERVLGSLLRFSENPETARIALASMASLPAPIAADLLYEVWTGTVQRSDATDLARALLYSKDQRPKATPALAVALDLRVAENCEQNRAILPRAVRHGDRRSLHLLTKLQRRYGCGKDKRQDCYSCLRKGDELDEAVKAVKARKEPKALLRR